MKSLSKITLGILLIINLLSLAHFRNWSDWMLINGDSYGYYSYLPMVFIHHDYDDLRLSTYYRTKNMLDHAEDRYTPQDMPNYWITGIVENGKRVIQYNCGVALLQMPFFFVAHILATPLGFSADGYSLPYRLSLLLGNLIYVLLGLVILRQILKRYFDEKTTALTLSIIMLTTNLYYFTAFSGFMAHTYLFSIYALFLYFVIRFYETYDNKFLWLMGFIAGWIMLIRPPDIVVLIIPFLYKLNNINDLKQRLKLLWSKKTAILGAIPLFLLPITPQLFYWKRQTGHWIFYLYNNVTFDFKHPDILDGLTSFGNGWLIYTPVMVLALLGLIFSKRSDFRWAILVFIVTYSYIIFSWPIRPFYINGFGSRPMVEAYALLAIPLSIFIEKMLKSKVLTTFFLVIIGFLTWLNIFQTEQMSQQTIISENGNKAFWLESFGKTTLDYNALVAFDANELQPKQSVFIKKLFENGFESPPSPMSRDASTVSDSNYVKQPYATGQYAYRVNVGAFSPAFKIEVKNLQGGRYIKVMLQAYSSKNSIWEIYKKSMLVVEFRRGEKELKWRGIRIENKIDNATKIYGGQTEVWGDIHFYVKIPLDVLPEDILSCYVWNQNTSPLVIDDFKVELHK